MDKVHRTQKILLDQDVKFLYCGWQNTGWPEDGHAGISTLGISKA